MKHSALYGVPSVVRVLLCLFAAFMSVGGFWLLSGALGLVFAALALAVRACLRPATLIRLTCVIRRRQAVTTDDRDLAIAQGALQRLCERAGCAIPTLALVTGNDLNAFAVAGFRGNAIIITQGFLASSIDECSAVLAHELGHLARHDALLFSLLLIGPLSLLTGALGLALGDPTVTGRVAGLGDLVVFIPNLLLVIASLTLLLALTLRPRLEWAADAAAVTLLGEHQPLITALEHRTLQTADAHGRAQLVERLRRLQAQVPR